MLSESIKRKIQYALLDETVTYIVPKTEKLRN